MDNKKRLEEGAIVIAIFVWILSLIVVLAGILNSGEAFRIVCVFLLAGANVFCIVKVIKYVKENYRTLY